MELFLSPSLETQQSGGILPNACNFGGKHTPLGEDPGEQLPRPPPTSRLVGGRVAVQPRHGFTVSGRIMNQESNHHNERSPHGSIITAYLADVIVSIYFSVFYSFISSLLIYFFALD